MDDQHFEHIVIGGGIEGSSTAYQLAKRGCKTLLIEQFPLGHSRGSSHGYSRIIRRAYREEYFGCMMDEAYEDWFQIERLTGKKIYTQASLLHIGKPPYDYLEDVSSVLKKLNCPHHLIDNETVKARFPMLNYPSDYKGLIDDNAGVLQASLGLTCIQDLFIKEGGLIKDNHKVVEIIPGEKIKVKTHRGDFVSNSIVICCGPWAPKILAGLGLQLPLKPIRTGVYYWKELQPGTFAPNNFPSLIDVNSCEHEIYALPSSEYPGLVKLCIHSGPNCDPDRRDFPRYDAPIDILSKYIQKFISGLETTPSIEETCYYTMTPDNAFILDRHPHHTNIVIGAGFSGTGFKLGPVVGKILADLSQGKSPRYDMQPFCINRFHLE